MQKLAAVVLGLGQIGQGYDYDHPDDSLILTHATGFAYHEAYELVAAVDPDPFQRERFEKKFGRPAYRDVQTLLSQHQPEMVSIAVPTASHYQVFQEVMSCQPRAVLCEKPIATCVRDAKRMVALAEENECALVVNYIRRFEPGVLELKRAIQSGDVGEIYKGTVWYSKGLLNNGSHFLDLLRFLLGDVTHIHIIDKGRKWNGKDPEPDVCLRFGETSVCFLAAREECFSIGEIVLIGTQGMIHYAGGGGVIEVRKTQPDTVYRGYTILNQAKQTIPTASNRYQWHVLEALYHHLTEKTPLNSDGKSATEILAVIEDVFELL